MVSQAVVSFARQSIKIDSRYDNQLPIRRDWTPKQKKRMRKQRSKYRARFLGRD
jgi:hypothetical protein